MRITENNLMTTPFISNTVHSNKSQNKSADSAEAVKPATMSDASTVSLEDTPETRAKVQQAVDTMNELLSTTNSTSKFMYHEGLDRYYVTVVDKETEEVVKEIPPKKLLDGFYEMQKLLGIIVDEKI